MQIFLNNISGSTLVLDLDTQSVTLDGFKAQIEAAVGVPAAAQTLSVAGKPLLCLQTQLQEGVTVFQGCRLLGGEIDPAMEILARKYRADKQVCRKCYARLDIRATNCRKRKCGHSNQLRIKKKIKKKN